MEGISDLCTRRWLTYLVKRTRVAFVTVFAFLQKSAWTIYDQKFIKLWFHYFTDFWRGKKCDLVDVFHNYKLFSRWDSKRFLWWISRPNSFDIPLLSRVLVNSLHAISSWTPCYIFLLRKIFFTEVLQDMSLTRCISLTKSKFNFQ